MSEGKLTDMLLGAILFGFGMTYLFSGYRTINRLNNTILNKIMEQDNLYQQYSDATFDTISDEELYAVTMGYLEYPIVIDGTEFAVDNTFDNFTIIKDGYYQKSYEYKNNTIVKVIYYYLGNT